MLMTAKRWLPGVMLLCAGVGSGVHAQATGTTTFNAPYRAFTNTEFGLLLSFPSGGGTAFEGIYRLASSRFDIGFKGGLFDPSGPGNAVLLVGTETRERGLTHSPDFPLGRALV